MDAPVRSDSALRLALVALLVLSPLPFGAVRPGAVLALELWVAAMGALGLWIAFRQPERIPSGQRILWVGAALLILVGIIQWVPVPAGLRRLLAEPGVEIWSAVRQHLPGYENGLRPLSLHPPATIDAVLRLAAYATAGVCVMLCASASRQIRRAAILITGLGAFQALYGSAEYLSGHQHIFGYAKKYYLDSATGTFINRNHFASYLVLTLPFALGLVLETSRHYRRPARWRDFLLQLSKPRTALLIYASTSLILIWLGILLSFSRGGLAAALVATIGFLAFSIRRGRAVWLLILLLAVSTLYLSWQQARAPAERFVSQSEQLTSLNNRLPIWSSSVRMAPHFFVVGSGLGTFAAVFPMYQPSELAGHWKHAHNDWLQVQLEGGTISSLLLLGLCVALFLPLRTALLLRGSVSEYTFSAAAALIGSAFHSILDFAPRIPAIAILLVVVAGLLAGQLHGTRFPVTSFASRMRHANPSV